jgi:uncharacterized protein (TIGR02246 family)
MISTRVKMVLAVFLFFLLSMFPAAVCWAQMPSHMDADTVAIKQCVAAWEDAWNHHDAHATAMRYVEDGDFSNTRGIPSHGWKALEEHYNAIFTANLKDAHRTDSVKSIRFLTPEIASVDIDWQMTGAKTPDGKEIPLRKGLLTWIVTKHDRQWRIAIYHETAF